MATSGKWTKAGEFDFEVNASMLVGPFYYMLPQTTKARYIRIYITDSNDKNATRRHGRRSAKSSP